MFSVPLIQVPKRRREDDLDLVCDEDEARRHDKRPRALPFRTSPTAKHSPSSFSQNHSLAFRPQTLTPVDSSDDDSDDEMSATFSRRSQEPHSYSSPSHHFAVPVGLDVDDMDMTEAQPPSSPTLPEQSRGTSSSMVPPPFAGLQSSRANTQTRPILPPKVTNPDPFLSIPSRGEMNPDGGRIPTPVYGHFSQVGPGSGMLRLPTHATPRDLAISPIPASPMSPGEPTSEAAWWQRRRLPSPVEDPDQEDTPMSPVGIIDNMLPRLNVSPSPRSCDINDSMVTHSDPTVSTPGMGSVRRSSSPFGRARSNATSSGTSPSTTSTTRLSMGYRADCEKCVRRVPGHYTHILR